jgi:hypothetical protein
MKKNIEAEPISIKGVHRAEHFLTVSRDGERLIALDYDGGATFGERYTPDKAVREFWDAMRLDAKALARIADRCGYEIVKKEPSDEESAP